MGTIVVIGFISIVVIATAVLIAAIVIHDIRYGQRTTTVVYFEATLVDDKRVEQLMRDCPPGSVVSALLNIDGEECEVRLYPFHTHSGTGRGDTKLLKFGDMDDLTRQL